MSDQPRRLQNVPAERSSNGSRRIVFWVGPIEAMDALSAEMLARVFCREALVCEVIAVTLAELEERLRGADRVDAVLSPLFWRDGDGFETAKLLDLQAFGAPYRIVAPPLPRPDLVLRELRAACPGLDLDLIELPAPKG
jgi:hypothetical protein